MTPLDLQDDVAKDLQKVFKEYKYKDSEGKLVPLHIYTQNVPVNSTDDNDDLTPYIIVRVNGGYDSGLEDSSYEVDLVIIVGLWDNDPKNQGYRDLISILNKVYERYSKNPITDAGTGSFCGGWNFAMQEDAYFPYHFAAATMKFNIAAVRRELDYIWQ